MNCDKFATIVFILFQFYLTSFLVNAKTNEEVDTLLEECRHFCGKQNANGKYIENTNQCQCTLENSGKQNDSLNVTKTVRSPINIKETIQHNRQTRSVDVMLNDTNCDPFCKERGYSGSLFQNRLRHCQCYLPQSVAYDTYRYDGKAIGKVNPPIATHKKEQKPDPNSMALVLHRGNGNSLHSHSGSISSSSSGSGTTSVQPGHSKHADSASIQSSSSQPAVSSTKALTSKSNSAGVVVPHSSHSHHHAIHASIPERGTDGRSTMSSSSQNTDSSTKPQTDNSNNGGGMVLQPSQIHHSIHTSIPKSITEGVATPTNNPHGKDSGKKDHNSNDANSNQLHLIQGNGGGLGSTVAPDNTNQMPNGVTDGNYVKGSSSSEGQFGEQGKKGKRRHGKRNRQQFPIEEMPGTNGRGQSKDGFDHGTNKHVLPNDDSPRSNSVSYSDPFAGLESDNPLGDNAAKKNNEKQALSKDSGAGQDGNQGESGRRRKRKQHGQQLPMPEGSSLGNNDGRQDGNQGGKSRRHKGKHNSQQLPIHGMPDTSEIDQSKDGRNKHVLPNHDPTRSNSDSYSDPFAGLESDNPLGDNAAKKNNEKQARMSEDSSFKDNGDGQDGNQGKSGRRRRHKQRGQQLPMPEGSSLENYDGNQGGRSRRHKSKHNSQQLPIHEMPDTSEIDQSKDGTNKRVLPNHDPTRRNSDSYSDPFAGLESDNPLGDNAAKKNNEKQARMSEDSSFKDNGDGQDGNQGKSGRRRRHKQRGQQLPMPEGSSLENYDGNQGGRSRRHKSKHNSQQLPIHEMPDTSEIDQSKDGTNKRVLPNHDPTRSNSDSYSDPFAGLESDNPLGDNAAKKNEKQARMSEDSSFKESDDGKDVNQRKSGRRRKRKQRGQQLPMHEMPDTSEINQSKDGTNKRVLPNDGDKRSNSDSYSDPFAGLESDNPLEDNTGKKNDRQAREGKNGGHKSDKMQNSDSVVARRRKRKDKHNGQQLKTQGMPDASGSGQSKDGFDDSTNKRVLPNDDDKRSNSDSYSDPFAGLESDNPLGGNAENKNNDRQARKGKNGGHKGDRMQNGDSTVVEKRKRNRSKKSKNGGMNSDNNLNANGNGNSGTNLNMNGEIPAPPSSQSQKNILKETVNLGSGSSSSIPGHSSSSSIQAHPSSTNNQPSSSSRNSQSSSPSTHHHHSSPSTHGHLSSSSPNDPISSPSTHKHTSVSSSSGSVSSHHTPSSHGKGSSSSASSDSNSVQHVLNSSSKERILPDSKENCEKFCAIKKYEGGDRYNVNRNVCQCYTAQSVSYDEYDKTGKCSYCARN